MMLISSSINNLLQRFVMKYLCILLVVYSVTLFGGEETKECDCQISTSGMEGPWQKLFDYLNINAETRLSCIQKLLHDHTKQEIQSLMVDRRGEAKNANMTTIGLQTVIKKGTTYLVTMKGLETMENYKGECLELSPVKNAQQPKHIEVEAVWDPNAQLDGSGNNILGGNGRFLVKGESINVPVVVATDETLAYYGARTIRPGDKVRFPSDIYPIWLMNLGKNYLDSFIMSEKGGGMYMEYHNDKPHFHMPLSEDAGGYLLLVKKIEGELDGKAAAKFHLTGFKIPYGIGVYTNRGSIHSDAPLYGLLWLVGYTDASDYSTVLIRQQNTDKKIKINFVE